MSLKIRRVLMWTLLSTLMAGLVWAGLELGGMANKSAADAGSNAADMEIASIDSIKKAEKSTINWKKERALYKSIQQADTEYRGKLSMAQSDISSTGKVSPTTRDAGMASAKKFQGASEAYAAFWDNNNGPSRAKLAREAGASRIKSADMAFNDISTEKIDAYNAQQDSLRTAQQGYFGDAKNDLSVQDRASLKSGLAPKLQTMTSNVANLMTQIVSLILQVKDQAGFGLNVGSVAGCAAKQVASGGNPVDGIAALFSPLQALLSLVKSMSSNLQNMTSDLGSF